MIRRYAIGETACREFLLAGNKVTFMEAAIMFGIGSLTGLTTRMRQEGYIVKTDSCSYAAAVERLSPHARLVPPPNLPIKEIQLTEYWVSR
jgi:hypothetical protein